MALVSGLCFFKLLRWHGLLCSDVELETESGNKLCGRVDGNPSTGGPYLCSLQYTGYTSDYTLR